MPLELVRPLLIVILDCYSVLQVGISPEKHLTVLGVDFKQTSQTLDH